MQFWLDLISLLVVINVMHTNCYQESTYSERRPNAWWTSDLSCLFSMELLSTLKLLVDTDIWFETALLKTKTALVKVVNNISLSTAHGCISLVALLDLFAAFSTQLTPLTLTSC